MNKTVPQSVIDRATERDASSAAAEYLAEFRSDLEAFVTLEIVEAAITHGVRERAPITGITYRAFVDPSGSASDSMTMAIAHLEKRDGKRVLVLDVIRERLAPFSPEAVVTEFAETLKRYRCQSALDWDPLSASRRDPFERRVRPVALAPSELAGVAETVRARVV